MLGPSVAVLNLPGDSFETLPYGRGRFLTQCQASPGQGSPGQGNPGQDSPEQARVVAPMTHGQDWLAAAGPGHHPGLTNTLTLTLGGRYRSLY